MSDEKEKEEAVAQEDVSESELDQLMEDLASEDATASVETEEEPVAEVRQLPAASRERESLVAEAEQSLKLELKGSINLKLCFSSGERSIEVFCAEEALICRMADGTEFKIPTGIHKKSRAA